MPQSTSSNRRRPAPRARGVDRVRPQVRRNTVRLAPELARKVSLGHPLIYREAIRDVAAESGAQIDLVGDGGEFLGRAIYEPVGTVALRVFTRRERAIDASLVRDRVAGAAALRRRFVPATIEACRLVNGESDGLPGFVVERFGDYLVVQSYSSSLDALREPLFDALMNEWKPKGIYEQRRIRPLSGDAPAQGAADLVRGMAAPVDFLVKEGDLTFSVDVTAPLSTGLFCDLRDGRACVRRWAKDRRVLNLFSYTGAISVAARAGGATEVVAVDVAAKAHARARKNFTASGFDPERVEHIVGDSFKVMATFIERGRKFDMVVIDPPAFASAASRGGKAWSATRDYAELVADCLRVLEPGGLLAAASSTHKMSHAEFDAALADGAYTMGTSLQVIERVSLPVDFPVVPGFPDGNYLKFAVATRG